MSKTTDEKKKKEIVHVGSYNATIFLDRKPFDSITVEGTSPVDAFEKLLRWYLIFRSSYFKGLVYEKVEELVSNYDELGVDNESEPLALGRFAAMIPLESVEKHLEVIIYKRIIV